MLPDPEKGPSLMPVNIEIKARLTDRAVVEERARTLVTECLRESKLAGYSGVETGGKFPKTAAELGPILREHGLNLASGWYSGTVLDTDLEEEKDKAREQLTLFRELDAACLAYGETAGTIQNVRGAPLATRRRLSEEDIKSYGRRLTDFAENVERPVSNDIHAHARVRDGAPGELGQRAATPLDHGRVQLRHDHRRAR